jgi:hypothetical protein
MTMKTESTTDKPADSPLASPLCSLDFLTPEFLYKALRPDMSWEINADKSYWEYETWKLKSAIMRQSNHACRYHRGMNQGLPAESCPDCKANASVEAPRK